MKQYKVIALSVSGKGKNIFKAGDTVLEVNFEERNIPELIKGQFIEEAGEIVEEASLLKEAKLKKSK